MHERGMVEDLVRHAESICASQGGKATRVTVNVGALTGVDPEHVDHYFKLLVGDDSPLAGADLVVSKSDELDEPAAMSVSLDSMTFEDR